MSNTQLQIMVSYMEQHTLFARNQITKLGSRGHDKYITMWKQLTEELNNCDGVKKKLRNNGKK